MDNQNKKIETPSETLPITPPIIKTPETNHKNSFVNKIINLLLFIAANVAAYLTFWVILIIWGLFVVGLFNNPSSLDEVILLIVSGLSYGIIIYATLSGRILKRFKAPNILLISVLGLLVYISNLYIAHVQGSRLSIYLILLSTVLINTLVFIVLSFDFRKSFKLIIAVVLSILISVTGIYITVEYANHVDKLLRAKAVATANAQVEARTKAVQTQKETELAMVRSKESTTLSSYNFYTLSQNINDIKSFSAGYSVIKTSSSSNGIAEVDISYSSENVVLNQYANQNKSANPSSCNDEFGRPNEIACIKTSMTFMGNPVYKLASQASAYGITYYSSDGITRIEFFAPNDTSAQGILSNLTKINSNFAKQLVNLPYQSSLGVYQ